MKALTKIIIAASLTTGVSACSSSVEQSEKLTKVTDTDSAHAAHGHVDKTGTYATIKPGASVRLNSILPKSMTSGTYQTVQLQLKDGYQDGTMSVTIEPSAGLTLFGGVSSKTFNMTEAGPHIWDVDVKAENDGVYFLNIFANAKGQSRSFSVRMDMGVITQKMLDDAMPENGELSSDGKYRVFEVSDPSQ